MGYQHLESHPETSPVENNAAICDLKERRGDFSRSMVMTTKTKPSK